MAHSRKHTPPSAKKAMAGRMAKKKAASNQKVKDLREKWNLKPYKPGETPKKKTQPRKPGNQPTRKPMPGKATGSPRKPASKISKRQALMAERVERSPKKRRTVGQPPNRSMSARAKAYQRSKMEQMRKGNPGAKKFQQPGGRRGSG